MSPELAAMVTRYVMGERFNVRAECARIGESKTTFYKYVARFKDDGVDGLYPRTRRPKTSPTRLPTAIEDVIVRVRKELTEDGWDGGADSIRFKLEDLAATDDPDRWSPGQPVPARATINRVLARRGQLVAVPQRRPKSSKRRFQAAQPNTRWQMDGFEVLLADGRVVVVLHIIDDCSRLDIALRAVRSENAVDVWDTFTAAVKKYGLPREVLTDNGTAFSGKRRGWLSAFEQNLAALGVKHIASSIAHPQTCGKCERGHQTCLKWLRKRSYNTIEALNSGLETYRTLNNNDRRRVHLEGMTPAQRYALGPLDGPAREPVKAVLVRTAVVEPNGTIKINKTNIGVGRRYARTMVTCFRRGRQVTIFNSNGLIAEFDLKTSRGGYQSANRNAKVSPKT